MTKRTASELWDALDEATIDAEMESVLAMTPEERRRELVAAGYDLDKVHADADAFFESLPEKIAAAAAASPEPGASAAAPVIPASAEPASSTSPAAAAPAPPPSAAAPPAPAPPAAVVVPTPSAPLPAPAAPAAPLPAPAARVAKRWRRPAVLVPTALALAAGAALTFQGLSPETVLAPRPEDPPVVQAAALRRDARGACEAQSWKVCLHRLDDARALDPGGDDTPEVRALRHAATEGIGHP
jgi:hypothetical protein